MKIKLFTFCLLILMIFYSCKKEEISNTGNSGVPGNASGQLLSKVLVDNQSAYEYVYNDSNLVIQEKSKYNFIIHQYNNKGQLVTTQYYGNDNALSSDPQISAAAISNPVWVTPQNGTEGGTLEYEYSDNGQLNKAVYSTSQSTISEYSDFTFDSHNRISRQTMYWDNTATGYIDYSYDGNGNLITENLYNLPSAGVTELITTTQYVFDSNQNPFKSLKVWKIPGTFTNQNNIIKETYTIHLAATQGSDNVQVTTNTYVYNDLGYPVSKNGNVSYVYK
jgi:hypothetical protein